jgi:hypothetical protein
MEKKEQELITAILANHILISYKIQEMLNSDKKDIAIEVIKQKGCKITEDMDMKTINEMFVDWSKKESTKKMEGALKELNGVKVDYENAGGLLGAGLSAGAKLKKEFIKIMISQIITHDEDKLEQEIEEMKNNPNSSYLSAIYFLNENGCPIMINMNKDIRKSIIQDWYKEEYKEELTQPNMESIKKCAEEMIKGFGVE